MTIFGIISLTKRMIEIYLHFSLGELKYVYCTQLIILEGSDSLTAINSFKIDSLKICSKYFSVRISIVFNFWMIHNVF